MSDHLHKKYSASRQFEGLKIHLDPLVTLSQRQKEDELDSKCAELINQTSHESHGVKTIKSSRATDHWCETKDTGFQYPTLQTFQSEDYFRIFNQDTLNIKDFGLPRGHAISTLCDLSTSELHEYIGENHLKRPYFADAVLHPLCNYLFLLMSVHRDERIVSSCSGTLFYIKRNWRPSLDCIFTIFVNWGIDSECLDIHNLQVCSDFPLELRKSCEPSKRFEDYNLEKVLEVIYDVAKDLLIDTETKKIDKLLQVLVVASLDDDFKLPMLQSYFSVCIGKIANAIPQEDWNCERVKSISELLLPIGVKSFHKLAEVCLSILVIPPRSLEVAYVLALEMLNNVLSTEEKIQPVSNISERNIYDIISHYSYIHKLDFSVMSIAIQLIDFCFRKEFTNDTLIKSQLDYMVQWLSELPRWIPTVRDSVDDAVGPTAVKELISRCLTNWRMMKLTKENYYLINTEPSEL